MKENEIEHVREKRDWNALQEGIDSLRHGLDVLAEAVGAVTAGERKVMILMFLAFKDEDELDESAI